MTDMNYPEKLRLVFYTKITLALHELSKGFDTKEQLEKYFSTIFFSSLGMTITTLAKDTDDPDQYIDWMCNKIASAARTLLHAPPL